MAPDEQDGSANRATETFYDAIDLGMGMARQSGTENQFATGTGPQVRSAADTAVDGGPQAAPDAHRTLIRAQLLRGDIAVALAAARQVADAGGGGQDAVDLLVDVALAHGRCQLARGILAEAGDTIPDARAAQIKARIALAEGDLDAAKAILVMAIEADPTAAPLRTLLAEVMVAAGTAADARAVLSVLGHAPVNPPHPDAAADDDAMAEVGSIADKRIG